MYTVYLVQFHHPRLSRIFTFLVRSRLHREEDKNLLPREICMRADVVMPVGRFEHFPENIKELPHLDRFKCRDSEHVQRGEIVDARDLQVWIEEGMSGATPYHADYRR